VTRAQKQRPLPGPTLDAEGSAALREKILQELEALSAADDVTIWAGRILKQKNMLESADSSAVERAFEAKIATLISAGLGEDEPVGRQHAVAAQVNTPGLQSADARAARPPLVKTVRRRDKKHLRFVCTQPCLVCGRVPSEPHHLRFAEPRALGRKVSDEFTVPLCRAHHRELHNRGNERAWWDALKIDPAPVAQQLWAETR
jgi:hypothetical protein